MNSELLKFLSKITEEEQNILDGQSGVDRKIYTQDKDFTVDSKKMMSRGRLFDFRMHTRFIDFPKHKHNYIEIIYMCKGQTTHIINDSTEVVLKEGELLFLNQHTFHAIKRAQNQDIAVNFIVLPEFFDVSFNMIDKGNLIGEFLVSTLCNNANEGKYLHFQVAGILPVQNLVENMVWSLLNRVHNQYYLNQNTMGLLLLQLLNHTDKIDRQNKNQFDNVITMNVLSYIEANYKTANLTDLARSLNQSVFQLSKLVKSTTNSTFKDLLIQKRLNKATTLLKETDLTISDIITGVGYDNTSYFYRIFKSRFGISPSSYRRNRIVLSGK